MKVLHLFNEINFSGAEIMYANAAPLFQEKGIELMAFSTGKKFGNFVNIFEKQKIESFHKPIDFYPLTIKGIKYYLELFQFIKKEHIKVLHIHRSDLYFAAFVAWLAKVRCIKTQHNTFRNRWFTKHKAIFQRFILRKVFKATFQTIGQSVYENELHYYKNPSVRINNWVDNKKFYPIKDDSERNQIRKRLGIKESTFVIISTGGCSLIKNHQDIIRAISLLKDKIDITYLHLGSGKEEENEKKMAQQLGIWDQTLYLGNQEKVRDFLIAADVYVMPSKFEGLGNAALEAMACKVPCILYDVPGLKDLIEDNNNGFLVSPNFKKLAGKIINYRQNPLLAKIKTNNAYEFVTNEFQMRKNVSKMIDLYFNV